MIQKTEFRTAQLAARAAIFSAREFLDSSQFLGVKLGRSCGHSRRSCGTIPHMRPRAPLVRSWPNSSKFQLCPRHPELTRAPSGTNKISTPEEKDKKRTKRRKERIKRKRRPVVIEIDGAASILRFDHGKGKHSGGLARPASMQLALSILEMECHLRTIRSSRHIVFIGCGTSYKATLAARPILEEFSGKYSCYNEVASDLLDRQGPIYRENITVFVRQSGETANTLHTLEYALENGAPCVGITNTIGSAIARNTHCGVHINAGAEIGMASTKAYTSQIVVKAMLASSQARKESIIEGLFELPSKVLEVLKIDQEMKDLAKLLIAEQSLLVFGRGYNYATAFEGALKVKEVAPYAQ
ncbi:hypothetical protein HYC85_026354 [Camellia sinensis]|uniref:SIS domain-containing protein n=1 Tax=Camellia sinensis TaxID=4442 RepID=A0A7J7G4L8_CAMSI|nr:hypothetical protein HYC85_026354 [Camellia sinensis]